MIEQITSIIMIVIGSLILIAFGYFGFLSLHEREKRAARISFLIALLGPIPLFGLSTLDLTVRLVTVGIIIILIIIFLILFLLPIGRVDHLGEEPARRFDERDIIFARFRLSPDSPEFEAYYNMRPENKPVDDLTRSKPGLNSAGSLFWNPFLSVSVDASFTLTEAMNMAVDGPVAVKRHALPVDEVTAYIKNLAKYYGALDVGITELKPYHVYSHVGRGPGKYGDPIPVEQKYAIAFTVEMDYDMIGPNPRLQGSMESARQYVECGRVAVQLAAAIRLMGYPARGHMDGNYRVICPTVARDAGLGEIGRMGILMTPRHGPRVRIAVVTTDLELRPDGRCDGKAIIDFCTICKKCALTCPSQSIPFEDRQEAEGSIRWKINADTCFRYWAISGTDCGRCMTVCPYSHPNNPGHNLIRAGISKSGFFRRIAIWMDDFFYGKKPARREAPKWTQVS
ncbi:MAG: 4Fe-4S dicluster domain-containing protein [Anaerolineaceae bacterium]|nr:4Fe-4S dicluster domain-containing protein [Anaerolineaceae bacterium]